MDRHLVLVGMMGSGKSTVGRGVAEALGCPFHDVDDAVAAAAGCTVAELFEREGEAAFRRRESAMLGDLLAAAPPTVIATGGGAVLDPANRTVMRERGTVLWLRATPEVLAARLVDDEATASRPLLADAGDTADVADRLAELGAVRASAYHQVAHDVVTVDHLSVADTVERILAFLEEAT